MCMNKGKRKFEICFRSIHRFICMLIDKNLGYRILPIKRMVQVEVGKSF